MEKIKTFIILDPIFLSIIIREESVTKIVTDVGMSMCSGWGTLSEAVLYDDGTLELVFK